MKTLGILIGAALILATAAHDARATKWPKSPDEAGHQGSSAGEPHIAGKPDLDYEWEGDQLIKAVEDRDLSAVEAWIKGGGLDRERAEDREDWETLLHIAATEGAVDIVKALIKGGANIEARDDVGATPLHNAAWGETSIVKVLIEAGADVEARDNDGNTPLYLAKLSSRAPESLRDKRAAERVVSYLESIDAPCDGESPDICD